MSTTHAVAAPVPRGTGEQNRNLALDGVRGCAILAVLASHLLWSNNVSSSPWLQALFSIRDLLWVGVTLFFALSGFLITGILYDTLETPEEADYTLAELARKSRTRRQQRREKGDTERYFTSFYARRCLRIFPLYYGVLFALLLLTGPLHFDWHGQAWRLLTYTPSIPFLNEWSENPAPYINLRHFWSLAVEEQFYLVWPFLIVWLRTPRRILTAAFAGSLLALALRTVVALLGLWPQNHSLPFAMDALLLGSALAIAVRGRYRESIVRWGGPVFLAAAAITIGKAIAQPGFAWATSFYLTTIGMTIVALGATGLIASALHTGSFAARALAHPVLRFFGRYSYGLYVYHYSIDQGLTGYFRGLLAAHGVPHTLQLALTAAIILALSTALSVASYHLYERHFIELKRFFPYRRAAPLIAVPVVTDVVA